MPVIDLSRVRCVVFDFGFTLSSDLYFKIAPPGYPHFRDVIQTHIFGDPLVLQAWMIGDLKLADMARIVAAHIDLPLPTLIDTMARGCTDMSFNPAVWSFACAQAPHGRKTALVTANMDVFTQVVVPSHRLDRVFDVILNTADHHTLDKGVLWDLAFARLGAGISYANSLLVEDGPAMPALFRERGGMAHEYKGDAEFEAFLRQSGWPVTGGLNA